jgi:hypothetical protein
MKCHKALYGYSPETLCDKLGLSLPTIGGLLGEIPDDIDTSKGSLAFERYTTRRHGYTIENKGGLSYTTAERKLVLFRILYLGHSQVDMQHEFGIGRSTVRDSIVALANLLVAVDPVKYSTIKVQIEGIKNLCRLGRVADSVAEIMQSKL